MVNDQTKKTTVQIKTNFVITKKQLGQYLGISNHNAVSRWYEYYCRAVGKPLTVGLTVMDIRKVDGENSI